MSETLKTDIYNKIDKATSDEIKNKAEFLEE
jgi:hypothetical protein